MTSVLQRDGPDVVRFAAGVAETTVTPRIGVAMTGWPRRRSGATGVRDELVVGALALASDDALVALVSIPVLALSRRSVGRIRERTRGLLPAANLMLSATHTHAGPAVVGLREMGEVDEDYTARLESAVVDAVCDAARRRQPATLMLGTARAAAGVNRRLATADGFALLPNPSGPVDDRVTALTVVGRGGDRLAVWFAHGVHPTTLPGSNTLLSCDWPGEASRIGTERLGSPCLFSQGCCGDVNPWPGGTVQGIGAEVARALEAAVRSSRPASSRLIVAPLTSVLLPTEPGSREVELEIQAIRIGDLSLVALNAEPFVRTGAAIVAGSPFENTVMVGCANGCFGYLPDQEALDGPLGARGYEVEYAPYLYGTGRLIPEAVQRAVAAASSPLAALIV